MSVGCNRHQTTILRDLAACSANDLSLPKRFELSSFEPFYQLLSTTEVLTENDIAASDTTTVLAFANGFHDVGAHV